MKKNWWKESVVYQIYPRSFLDSNGDGIGDLRGIIEKLDYLKQLGVDVLWLCPIYSSPMRDNGYDISNYFSVAQQFGTLQDMEELLAKASQKGLRIILDLVMNHCSDQHSWFQKALAEPDSEEGGYFYFVRSEGKKPPNNWRANMGGSVWEPTGDGRWYYHTFSKWQPDFNWENPRLRQKIYEMVNWWLDRGVSGFRIDAITFIKKDTTFKSRYPETKNRMYPVENLQNYPGIGDFLKELRDETFGPRNCMTVAEAPGVPLGHIGEYAGDNGYFSMIFEFSYADMNQYRSDWSVGKFKKNIFTSQISAQKSGWYGLFFENHDQPRSPSKYIPPEDLQRFGDIPKKMLAALYFLLRGTPFLYQGQEIGMENYPFEKIGEYRDVMALQTYKEKIQQGILEEEVLDELKHTGRDNSRTPMQWDQTVNAGFSSGKPWISVNPDFTERNVKDQLNQEQSILTFYKQLIALRKSKEYGELFAYGDFRPAENPADCQIIYFRDYNGKSVMVICNFSAKESRVLLKDRIKMLLLSNYQDCTINGSELICKPYQAIIAEIQKEGVLCN